MKNITFDVLNNIFSASRVHPYREQTDSPEQTLLKYHQNIKIGILLLPSLHYLEICLRNQVDRALRNLYSEEWLIDPPEQLNLSEQDIRKIQKIKGAVFKTRREEATQDDIVAQLSFGFWCSLLQKKYDPIIWQRKNVFKTVFPNIEKSKRTRKYIEPQIIEIKKVRNRIAHHEPIWKNAKSISEVHTMCCRLIRAMSKEAFEMLESIDVFTEFELDYKA